MLPQLSTRAWLIFTCTVVALPAVAQKTADSVTATMRYVGTVGQQHVTVSLEVQGDAVNGGHYVYDGQKSDIRFTETRVFGTTAVLRDEDGSILHLHFRDTNGVGAPDWKGAAALEGTLDRGELDLPVRLERVEPGSAGKGVKP